MDRIRLILLTVFAVVIAGFLAVVALFETGVFSSDRLAAEARTEYVVRMVMELSALVCIPLALRLFRFDVVRRALRNAGGSALQKWGTVRILLLGIPTVLSIVCYYLFGQATYGYISLIFLISMVFVYPYKKVCENETANEEEQ